MNDWTVKDVDTGDEWHRDNRSDAEEAVEEFGGMRDLEIIPPNSQSEPEATTDGGTEAVEPDVVDQTGSETSHPQGPPNTTTGEMEVQDQDSKGLEELGESLDTDPLSILPKYMITHVDGKPSLNKRGVSVLAYHYGVSVLEKETVAYPHETDYTSAIVEMKVEGDDGRVFVGSGEAHADETPKHQLLRMAETRAYKRAVIFATGTGIVGYQEVMEELQ